MKSWVRPMQTLDVDKVYAIELAAHRAPWSSGIISDCVMVGYDCRILEIGSLEEPQLASYIISRYSESVCHVLNLCVAPALQGKGYGRILLQDVIDNPLVSDISLVYLEVRPSNHVALRLYQKMGFSQIGIKEGYYQDENGIEDAIILQKLR